MRCCLDLGGMIYDFIILLFYYFIILLFYYFIILLFYYSYSSSFILFIIKFVRCCLDLGGMIYCFIIPNDLLFYYS